MRLVRILVAVLCVAYAWPAYAVDAVSVAVDVNAIDLVRTVEFYRNRGDQLSVSTAPGTDGIVRRIEVRAREARSTPNWAVFALANETDEQIDRLLVAPHFRASGAGLYRPDLGGSRIEAITPSQGFRPDRQDSTQADIFLITLDPRSTVTFVAELRDARLPQLYLWEPDAYKETVNSFTLYQGIVIGIAGLTALFLTILFLVKGTTMLPAAAGLAWAVLAYLCIDFGFWHRVFDIAISNDRIYRACGEVVISATLLIFLFAYLNLGRWHVRFLWAAILWLLGLAVLLGLSFYDPPLAATIARGSTAGTALFGLLLIAWLSIVRRYDRAILLAPCWILLALWIAAAGATAAGALNNDVVAVALDGGLVLIVLLVGFTVMQHAFAGDAPTASSISQGDRRALALIGAGDVVWDWDVSRDRIYTSPECEQSLGLERGSLLGPPIRWLDYLHPSDRDRFRAVLDAILELRRGRIHEDFRLRDNEGRYRWFHLRARPVVGSDGEVIRCVGTLIDVTDMRIAQERLLHDAVHDNLTGLPNRELFLDRVSAALSRAQSEDHILPTIFVIDVDRFKQVNDAVGLTAGDSMLMTIARRLSRLLQPQDTLARLGGDQFGLILLSENQAERIALFAEGIRKAIRQPLTFSDREIFITASIGMAVYDGLYRAKEDILNDAELAVYHAKKAGADRVEAFKPSMRAGGGERLMIESELRRAVERGELRVFYQPVVRLVDQSIAGFEALVRWEHPRRGRIGPAEFIAIAEETGVIVELGLAVLQQGARQLAVWQRDYPSLYPLTLAVNVSSRQLLRQDLVNDVRAVLDATGIEPKTLKLEVTESLVMENPEYSAQVLNQLKELGVGLSLDDFGIGYSSLSYLQRFPFDTLKIDRAFVHADGSGRRPAILRSIVALAHDLEMDLVAEGAETLSDGLELRQLGCVYAQGYAFGQPMSAEHATLYLRGALRLAAAQ